MTSLVACLSSGKGSWQEVKEIIEKGEWDSIHLITDDFGVKRFSSSKKVNFIIIDSRKPSEEIIGDIRSQLKDSILGTEVALNIVSGAGKEHMAIISALLKLGFGIRLVELKGNKVAEI